MKRARPSRTDGKDTQVEARDKGRGGQRRKFRPLLAAVVVGVVAVIVLVAVLIPKGPDGTPPQSSPDVQTAGPSTDYTAMKEEAFEVVRQLMADFPESAFPLGMMGTVYSQYGNSAEAEQWWWKCLERDPKRADVYEVLAVAFLRKGEYQKVIELWDRARAVDPRMPTMSRHHAEALLEMGRLDEALAAADREKQVTPGASETHFVLGRIHLQRGEYAEAMGAYSRALELRPGDSRCYYGLATAATRLGDTEKAREYMARFNDLRGTEDSASTSRRRTTEEMRRAGPILADALVDAGRVYSQYQKVQKAEECWRRAAAIDPEDTACRALLVGLYRRTRRAEQALAVCGQLTEIDPDNASYYLMTGSVLVDLGQTFAAERAVRKAVELEPTGRNYSMLSAVCLRNHDRAGAIEAMAKAVQLAPDNEEYRKAYEKLRKEK